MIEQILKDLQTAFVEQGTAFVLVRPGDEVEQVIIQRPKQDRDVFKFTVPADTQIVKGALLRDANSNSHLVLDIDPRLACNATVCFNGVAQTCNGSATIQRRTQSVDEYLNVTGEAWQEVADGPAIIEHLRGGVVVKSGLIDDTEEIRITMQDAAIALSDRAQVGGKAYKVDEIDRTSLQGLMVLRCCTDTR